MPPAPPVTPNIGLPRFDSYTAFGPTILNDIVDRIDAEYGPWVYYRPVWSQLDGAILDISNGVLDGFYKQTGKIVNFAIRWQRGQGTSNGTAGQTWLWALPPVAPRSWNLLGGSVSGARNGQRWGGAWVTESSTTISAAIGMDGRVDGAFPFGATQVFGDWIMLTGTYEAA